LFFISASAASADETRLALVIGNSNYQTLTELKNPINDARLIAQKLEGLGFDTAVVENADRVTLIKAFQTLADKISRQRDSVAFIYYAGHGIQDDRQSNYLIPVDAQLKSQDDLLLQAVPLETLLHLVEQALPGTAVVILDSCRDNPLPSHVRGGGTRGLGVERDRRGIMIAFSTEPGKVAQDGDGANSPYAEALATEMMVPGLEVEQMFKKVRIRVLEATNEKQTPWETTHLTKNFFFVPTATPPVPQTNNVPAVAPTPLSIPTQRDPDIEYSKAVVVDTVEAYEDLLRMFPNHPKKSIIVALIDRKREEILWKDAEQALGDSEKIRLYDRLITAFPQGAYADRARQKLEELKRQAEQQAVLIPNPPPLTSDTSSYYYVTGLDPNGFNWLALRNAPSSQAPWSQTHMGPGTLVSVIERQGEWAHIRLQSNGETGWAHAKFLACCQRADNSAPAPQPQPPPIAVNTPSSGYYYVTGLDPTGFNWLALRNAPNSQAPWSQTHMGPGTLVSVLERQGEWARVRLRSNGEVGWANAKFLACCR
jgi:SH3-like domain-containing protein